MEQKNSMMESNQELEQNMQEFENTETNANLVESQSEEDSFFEDNAPEIESDEDNEDNDIVVENDDHDKQLPDFNKMSLEELLVETNKVINQYVFGESKRVIEIIKTTFYTKLNTQNEQAKQAFLEKGLNEADFVPEVNPIEETFKELIKVFKSKRAEALSAFEKEKEKNYQTKIHIIDEINGLVNTTEHFNQVYHRFKDLQDNWKSIKQVPSDKIRELNSKYQFVLNQFYDYLKINKELRELDLKKNQEHKEKMCERAEALLNSDSAKSAFVELQDLHQRWKDTGPVLDEVRENLWERFKEATKKINDKFQDYQNKLKVERDDNLIKKTEICEKAEEINTKEYDSPKSWEEASAVIESLQKDWRKIGMVPSKYNESIYKRFKVACDEFFRTKNDFYKGLKESQKDNLTEKMQLIEEVEALVNSQDWKNATDKIIKIQKDWKKIGPVPRKKSDAIWKRFRAACDLFFDNKTKHFENLHGDENENLKLKNELIEAIDKYQHKEDIKESLKDLKDFQNQWAEIGFVPMKHKKDIQDRYRTAINKQFDSLDVDAKERDLSRLKLKLDSFIESSNAKKLIFSERNKLVTRIKRVEADIQQLENNIGFFSSGTAKGLLKEYENKIKVNKKNLSDLQDKIRLIDKYIED
ncbi:MAG: DUF349 domain-containing protein [Bacteroidales bacterium]|nr:DUF349 domain-containing protein [Bacteroidales bacterium]